MTITESTPIAMLTVGQLREVLGVKADNKQQPEKVETGQKYVYGIAGIRTLFNVSHVTACKFKETIIREAVSQNGRVIVTDVEKAMELFAKHKEGKR